VSKAKNLHALHYAMNLFLSEPQFSVSRNSVVILFSELRCEPGPLTSASTAWKGVFRKWSTRDPSQDKIGERGGGDIEFS
jgi:hypothetical protein